MSKAFKNQKKEVDDDDMPDETVFLTKFNESQKNTHAQGGTQGDDDDDEDDDPRG